MKKILFKINKKTYRLAVKNGEKKTFCVKDFSTIFLRVV